MKHPHLPFPYFHRLAACGEPGMSPYTTTDLHMNDLKYRQQHTYNHSQLTLKSIKIYNLLKTFSSFRKNKI